jgi:MoxR-like ATPase
MALYLRKPMLVRGEPGVGKSSLAYSLAYHLGLGEVIRWPITSHTSIKDGLYRYDALDDLSKVIKVKEGEAREPREPRFYLGPLGQAVAQMGEAPAVLLLDEIDKSDMDLPNDLLHFLEDPSFRIDELVGRDIKANIKIIGADGKEGYQQPDNNGRIKCIWFPIIVMTSNQERPLPPAFLRRCITVKFDLPSEEKLIEIAKGWFPNKEDGDIRESVKKFIKIRTDNNLSLSTDACLQGVYQFIQTGRLDELEELYNSLNTNGHG